MKFIYSILILAVTGTFTFAQNIKRDVVVIGANAAGAAAAVQAARSGVKTTLIDLTSSLGSDISPADTVNSWGILRELKNKNLAPGIQLKSIVDTVKNLELISNVAIRKIEESGKGWEIKLRDGRDLKCLVIVDAADHTALLEDKPSDIAKRIIEPSDDLYKSRRFRASAASGNSPGDIFTLGSLVSVTENYVFASPAATGSGSVYTGQTAGAIAAYAAFFKTNTRNLNVRMTQGELLRYDARLIPLKDINPADSNFLALQHIAATGILKPVDGKFNPDSTVTSAELKLPLKEYYSRSQIWFADHKAADTLTIEEAISLIMFTATRGNELIKEIEQGWKTSFKFSSEYDPKRYITRRELAVLIDRFLQPFNVRVDFQGNLLS